MSNDRKIDADFDPTTLHMRGAIGGSRPDLDWIVDRFTPLLLAQAHYRLGPHLRTVQEPEDLVNDAWLIAIPRLVQIEPSDRTTPAVLQFLATTVANLAANIARKQLRRQRSAPMVEAADPDKAAADHTGIVTRAIRDEAHQALRGALRQLDEQDQGVIVLRGIEQLPGKAVGVALGISEGAVAMRYQRAMQRLRGLVGLESLLGLE